MWTCPKCNRPFHCENQWHVCTDRTIDDIFAGKPQELVYAFDELLLAVIDWEPNHVAAAQKAVVFTNKRAWLIVRPMSKQLDVAFYTGEPLHHAAIFKSRAQGKTKSKYRHQIRLSGPGELTAEHVDWLREGFAFGMR